MRQFIDQIEQAQLRGDMPEFSPGDTVIVNVRVKEGSRERIQAFEGVVIAKKNRGLNSAFTVRKISHGEGVERVFQTHSPLIESVTLKRRGDVRRAKLYYLRGLTGRAARIKERLNLRSSEVAELEAKAEAKKQAAAAAKAEKSAAEKQAAEAAKAEASKEEKKD